MYDGLGAECRTCGKYVMGYGDQCYQCRMIDQEPWLDDGSTGKCTMCGGIIGGVDNQSEYLCFNCMEIFFDNYDNAFIDLQDNNGDDQNEIPFME